MSGLIIWIITDGNSLWDRHLIWCVPNERYETRDLTGTNLYRMEVAM